MNLIRMFGPSLSDPSKMVERDVPEIDVQAYKAAGYVIKNNAAPIPMVAKKAEDKIVKMYGPSISSPDKIVGRDVPERDVNAYLRAGYKRGELPEEYAEPVKKKK